MNASKPSSPSLPASHAGTSAAPAAPSRVAQSPTAPVAAPAAALGSAPALFGGHRGGGKRRTDGLPAGGPEAKAADRSKDSARMAARRAAVKATALPAALPSVAATAAAPSADPGAALAGGASAVLGPSAVTGVAVVLWNPRLLEKPARLVTRIVDRVRKASATKRLDHPKLPAELKAEIKKDLELPPEALADFANALADCAAVELNKRGVGAGQSHWVTLAGSIAELGAHHVATMERLDRILAKLDEPESNVQESKVQSPKLP